MKALWWDPRELPSTDPSIQFLEPSFAKEELENSTEFIAEVIWLLNFSKENPSVFICVEKSDQNKKETLDLNIRARLVEEKTLLPKDIEEKYNLINSVYELEKCH